MQFPPQTILALGKRGSLLDFPTCIADALIGRRENIRVPL